jgi:O-6-methylguanine DNA methyltransferase
MGMGKIFYSVAETPWTRLLLASSAHGLMAAYFVSESGERSTLRKLMAAYPSEEWVESAQANHRTEEELRAYSAGELHQFTLTLDLQGTPFQVEVWRALLDIPYGETRTYADIARAVGRPQAFRAVGLANHSNPIPIIVPCHRVIGSTGRLVGYGGGLPLKKALLEHERRHAPRPSGCLQRSLSLWQ